jgi:hypothetical protein
VAKIHFADEAMYKWVSKSAFMATLGKLLAAS